MEFIDQYEAFINDCKHRLFEKFKISKDEFKKYLETIVEERKQCWFKTNGKLLLQEYHDKKQKSTKLSNRICRIKKKLPNSDLDQDINQLNEINKDMKRYENPFPWISEGY